MDPDMEGAIWRRHHHSFQVDQPIGRNIIDEPAYFIGMRFYDHFERRSRVISHPLRYHMDL